SSLKHIGFGAFYQTKLDVLDLSECWAVTFFDEESEGLSKYCENKYKDKELGEINLILDGLFIPLTLDNSSVAIFERYGVSSDSFPRWKEVWQDAKASIPDKCKVFLPRNLGKWEFDAKAKEWKRYLGN
ncbi:MAG: hypothetical protein LBQ43_00580, partial [Holosporales bacterium]|nr:hypothetical protein [Holosporales bacterium]